MPDWVELQSERINREWHYYYISNDSAKLGDLTTLIRGVLSDLRSYSVDTIYTLHNTFPHALLGTMAREQGFNVIGFYLDTGKLMINTWQNTSVNGFMWDKMYIGDRLSYIATGRLLDKRHFQCFIPASDRKRNTVTIFPGTRSKTLNAENWETDIILLKEFGFDIQVAHHESEIKSNFNSSLVSQVTFTDVKQLIGLITESDFIICNDSIAFHLAWYYDIPAIVKMKGGFQKEWQPRWVRDNSSYQFIPATNYFQEEYFSIAKEKLFKILEVIS